MVSVDVKHYVYLLTYLLSLLPVRRYAGKRKDLGSRFGSPFSSKVVVCGHGLVTLSLTINETLKWLSSLPILTQVILVVTV